MTLMRFDPFRELDRLSERVLAAGAHAMPTEAYRRGDTFVVLIDLPGVRTEDIQVTVERNVVNVQATRDPGRQEGDELLVDERPHGRFHRQFLLGDNLDSAGMNADYATGVLHLSIPVAAESKPRQVRISSAGGDSAPAQQVGVGAGGEPNTSSASPGSPAREERTEHLAGTS
jgi:HSP20 family protein